MAAKRNRSISGRAASLLTAIFMSAASIQSAGAAAPPEPDRQDNQCIQTMSPDDTAYKNFDDLILASAYAKFMEKQGRDPDALHAILEASEQTGVDFELMMAKAILESDLGRHSKPLHVNGSARGMFQYIDSTWLTVFAWYGDQYKGGGYADLAHAITFDESGYPHVDDPQIRQQILDLRYDHYVSSFIKAMQIKHDERPNLIKMIGHEPELTDYYIAHFLGLTRAKLFYEYLRSSPDNPAAEIFDREARYNSFVFYDHDDNPRSFAEVYDRLKRIIENRLVGAKAIAEDTLQKEECISPLHKGIKPPPADILKFNI